MANPMTRSLFSFRNEPPFSREKLRAALEKYCSDADLENLGDAYSHAVSRRESLPKNEINSKTVARSFKSFNIAPSHSYKRHLAVLQNRSDRDAIKSDWEAVGEDLSFALVKHILAGR